MSKKEMTKKSEYYLDFLKKDLKEGYTFEYFSEGLKDGNNKICLTLNIDCETYVLGELNREEIIEELNEKRLYISFGFDSQYIFLNIVNKDKFFTNHIIKFKEYLKKSIVGKDIQAINFYRRKGSEIYPPEISISFKREIGWRSIEWIKTSVELMSLLSKYKWNNGFKQLEFITPMSLVHNEMFGSSSTVSFLGGT
jgi:hypothetical protein